jgi:AGCS family alanine or glycine:cation symporter
MNKIVPFMCLIFIIICLYIIINNFNKIDLSIFYKDLLSIKSILSGLIIGIKRSIFMNEILIGTTSVGAASDKNDIKISTKYQILCVYFISIVITLLISCVLIIYLNSYKINILDYNLLLNDMFNKLLGNYGTYFLLIIYLLFGFTTILSGYYIGSNSIKNIINNKKVTFLFNILFIVSCILGIIYSNEKKWKFGDIFIFIMIIINSYRIIKLVMKADR